VVPFICCSAMFGAAPVMFMGLNVNVSVRVGGWPLKFPVRVAIILYWSGCQVVVFSWFSSIWMWYVAWVWFICWLWSMSTYWFPL